MQTQTKIKKRPQLVYGGIINLHTNEEMPFDGCSPQEAVAALRKLKGTVYETDWKYLGDLDARSNDANLFVSDAPDGKSIFFGETAVADFLKAWQ